jgi:hypothetical protein
MEEKKIYKKTTTKYIVAINIQESRLKVNQNAYQ